MKLVGAVRMGVPRRSWKERYRQAPLPLSWSAQSQALGFLA